MALIVVGRTVCPLCRRVIAAGDEYISFPAFIANKLDPLILFNDAAFHQPCFAKHPHAAAAISLLADFEARSGSAGRRCTVCKQPITDPDAFFTLGHLVSDRADPLYGY